MAGMKEIDDVSSAIMCMDTLAMDSMDMNPEAFLNVEAPPVLIGAQSIEIINKDFVPDKKTQQGKEMEDQVGSGAEKLDSLPLDSEGAEETGYDDEGLMTDPGTPDSHDSPATPCTPEDVHELDEIKDMNLDMAENDLEEETGDDDEDLMTDPGSPDSPVTPQEGFLQDVQGLDERKDMNLGMAENDLEEERRSDDEPQDAEPSTPREDSPQDVNESDETKDMTVDRIENDLEVSAYGGEEGEKSLDGEKFVAPFPITRVKRIIKLDKDVRLVSSDAIMLISQATALFVQNLSSASFTVMLQTKRKTIRGPDVVLAAKSTRQFRDCLGNDLATLLEESNVEDTGNGEDGPVEKEDGTDGEPARKKSQQQKSAKKHQLAPPPGSRPITNFFKA